MIKKFLIITIALFITAVMALLSGIYYPDMKTVFAAERDTFSSKVANDEGFWEKTAKTDFMSSGEVNITYTDPPYDESSWAEAAEADFMSRGEVNITYTDPPYEDSSLKEG